MKIFLNCSEIAALIGKNKFKNPSETIFRIWQKYFSDDFDSIVEGLAKKSIKVVPKETDKEAVTRVVKECKIDIKKELGECLQSTNINDLHKKKQDIIKKLPIEMPKEQKIEFKKSLDNMTHTNFGTKNETPILEQYIQKTKQPAITSNHYYNKKLFSIENNDEIIDIYLLGKVDALVYSKEYPKNNTVIEIKNRMYRYFYEVRDYEKIQIYSYMYILNYQNAHLVEALKNRESDINIVEVKFENEYWDYISMSIKQIMDYFIFQFMKDKSLREQLILDEENFNINLVKT